MRTEKQTVEKTQLKWEMLWEWLVVGERLESFGFDVSLDAGFGNFQVTVACTNSDAISRIWYYNEKDAEKCINIARALKRLFDAQSDWSEELRTVFTLIMGGD